MPVEVWKESNMGDEDDAKVKKEDAKMLICAVKMALRRIFSEDDKLARLG